MENQPARFGANFIQFIDSSQRKLFNTLCSFFVQSAMKNFLTPLLYCVDILFVGDAFKETLIYSPAAQSIGKK